MHNSLWRPLNDSLILVHDVQKSMHSLHRRLNLRLKVAQEVKELIRRFAHRHEIVKTADVSSELILQQVHTETQPTTIMGISVEQNLLKVNRYGWVVEISWWVLHSKIELECR